MSSRGGKIFFPAAASLSRNRLRSKNSLVTISPFKWANQLGCRVSISSCSSCFCSSVRVATHLALSNLATGSGATEADEAEPPLSDGLAPAPAEGTALGAPKKEVMLAFCLGFFGSDPAAWPAAFRLTDDMAGRPELRFEVGIRVRQGGHQVEIESDGESLGVD